MTPKAQSYTLVEGLFTNLRKTTNIQVRCDAYPITNYGFKGTAGADAGNHKGIVYDIQAANNVKASKWIVGLVRPNIPSNFNASGDGVEYLPAYFEPNNQKSFQQNQFYDYCVRRVGTQLRIFQSCIKSSRTSGNANDLVMEPIQYWGFGGTFDTEYNIGTNASGYRYIKFALSNEKVVIQISVDSTNWVDLVNQDQRTTPAKNTTCYSYKLYPMAFIPRYVIRKGNKY